jgi:hypothetical protein
LTRNGRKLLGGNIGANGDGEDDGKSFHSLLLLRTIILHSVRTAKECSKQKLAKDCRSGTPN